MLESDVYPLSNLESEGLLMTEFEDQSRAALAAKSDTERQLAVAAVYPQWRHAIFGLMMGGLLLAPILQSAVRVALFVLLACAVPLIAWADRKRTGMFINGYRPGKTLYVTFAILAVEMTLMVFGAYRLVEYGDRQTAILLAPVAVAIGWIGSIIWQRVLINELTR